MYKKVFWDTTYKCNGDCLYCFTNSGMNSDISKIKEIDMNQKIKIANYLIGQRVKKISFGGGEPFIDTCFVDLCNYLQEKLEISVTSNGSILNSSIWDMLIKEKCKITISLDTLNEQKFLKIRKNIDFNKVIENIKILVSNSKIRKNMSIRCTVTEDIVIEEVEELLQFCEELNIGKLKVNTTNLFGRAKQHKELIPNFNKFSSLLEKLNSKANSYNNVLVELPIKKYLGNSKQICTLGKSSIYIDPWGNVFPCAFSEGNIVIGNLIKDTYNDIENKLKTFSYNTTQCINCPIHRYEKIKK